MFYYQSGMLPALLWLLLCLPHLTIAYLLSPTNLIINGDFESYNLSSPGPYYYAQQVYSWYQETGKVYQIQKMQTPPILPTQSCDLSSNYSNTICQNLQITANKIYQVNIDIVFKFALDKYCTVGMYMGGSLVISATGNTTNTNSVVHGQNLVLSMLSSLKLCVKEINPLDPTVWAGPNVDNITLFQVLQDETTITNISWIILQDTYIQFNASRTNTTTITIQTNYTIHYSCIPAIFEEFIRVMIEDVQIGNVRCGNIGGMLAVQVQVPDVYWMVDVYVCVGLIVGKVRVGEIYGRLVGGVGSVGPGVEGLTVQYLDAADVFAITHTHVFPANTTNTTNTTTNSTNTNSNTNNSINTTNTNNTNNTNNSIPIVIITTIHEQITLTFHYNIDQNTNTLSIVTNYRDVNCLAAYHGCLPVNVEDSIISKIANTIKNYLNQDPKITNNNSTLQFIANPTYITNLPQLTQTLQQISIPSIPIYINPNTSTEYYLYLQHTPTSDTINPYYYYPQTSLQSTYTLNTKAIYLVFVNLFNKIYPFLSSGFSSFFFVKLISFWNISFLYIYLPLQLMPDLLYKVISDISVVYYSDMNFIEFYKYLSTGIKQPYQNYLTPIEQQSYQIQSQVNKRNQLSLILTNLNISTDFLNDNIEDLTLLTMLIFKLMFMYVLRDKLRMLRIKVTVRKMWYWLALEVLVSVPFFVLSSFCKFMLMGSMSVVSRINTVLHVVLIFIVIGVFIINYINTYNHSLTHTHTHSNKSNKSNLSKDTSTATPPTTNNQQTKKPLSPPPPPPLPNCLELKISNNHLLLDTLQCTIIPTLLIFGNKIGFFTITILLSLFKLCYTIYYNKYYSCWQQITKSTICVIWIVYNFLWFALYVGEKYYRTDSDAVPQFKYCGYAIILLLLVGGFVEIVALVVQIVKSVIQGVKHIIKIVNQGTQPDEGLGQNSKCYKHKFKNEDHQQVNQVDSINQNSKDGDANNINDHTQAGKKKKSTLWIRKGIIKSTKTIPALKKQQKNTAQPCKSKIKCTKNNIENSLVKSRNRMQENVSIPKTSYIQTSIQIDDGSNQDHEQIFYVPVVHVNIFEDK